MGVFTSSASTIRMLDQVVFVNGQRSDSLWCNSVSLGAGAGATTAEFTIHQSLFDTPDQGVLDQHVMVYALNAHDGSMPAVPDFAGFLDTKDAHLDPGTDGKRFPARTIGHYLQHVYVGQGFSPPRFTVTYRLEDPVTRRPTNWTPLRILEDIFQKLPSQYRAWVRLGNTAVLNNPGAADTAPEITFRDTPYSSAIEQIMALFGDVAVRERFDSSGICYFDFYRIGDPAAPAQQLTVCNWTDPVAAGGNVAVISPSATSAECKTRIFIVGKPRRFIVSCTTSDATEGRRLIKDWDKSLEAVVLADPKRAKPGAPGYTEGAEYVFARYRLPAVLRGLVKSKDLGVVRSNGAKYSAQVFKWPTLLEDDETNTHDKVGVLQTNPVRVQNVDFYLDEDYFLLREPAVNLMSIDPPLSGEKPTRKVYAEADVGITFAVEGDEFIADTGHDYGSDVALPFVSDGLSEVIRRDDMEFIQYTNGGFPINGQVFSAILFDEDAPHAEPTTVNTPIVVKDDTRRMRQLALTKQRERSRKQRSYSVTVPWFTRAVVPGTRLVFAGQADYVPDTYMVTQVTWDFDNNETALTADNVRPPSRREARAAR